MKGGLTFLLQRRGDDITSFPQSGENTAFLPSDEGRKRQPFLHTRGGNNRTITGEEKRNFFFTFVSGWEGGGETPFLDRWEEKD